MKKPPSDERLRLVKAKLEARAARRGEVLEPALVVAPVGTLPDEYAQELVAAGRKSPMLCVPAIPEGEDAVAQWERTGSVYQAWLLRRGAAIAEGADTSAVLTPREAYRRAIAGEPLPD